MHGPAAVQGHESIRVLERRLQALGDLDTHVEASGFVRSDFDAIVARCRAALLGDKLSCSSGSAQ